MVVDNDPLPVVANPLEQADQAPMKRLEVGGFVEGGGDNREHHRSFDSALGRQALANESMTRSCSSNVIWWKSGSTRLEADTRSLWTRPPGAARQVCAG